MSQYPGGQPPYDPYYGQQQPPGDPYAPPQGDPYYGQPPSDPYYGQPADPYAQPQYDPYYGQPPAGQQPPYQQQGWYGPPQGYWQQPSPPKARGQGGTGAAIVGIFLVLVGIWFLFRDEIALDVGRVWPAAAVGLGVVMVIASLIPRGR